MQWRDGPGLAQQLDSWDRGPACVARGDGGGAGHVVLTSRVDGGPAERGRETEPPYLSRSSYSEGRD